MKFVCSVCKLRTFYKEEMDSHLESRFHKDHLKFLGTHLSKPTLDFLQVKLLCILSLFFFLGKMLNGLTYEVRLQAHWCLQTCDL